MQNKQKCNEFYGSLKQLIKIYKNSTMVRVRVVDRSFYQQKIKTSALTGTL